MAQIESPGGFIFGIQGFEWGEQRPKSITFMLDGTAIVCDQYGRPIKGAVVGDKEVFFAKATHIETIEALAAERVDWQKLACAGWPQLPYDELKKLSKLPPTPKEELLKIKNTSLRKDALRARREADEAEAKELAAIESEQ